MLSGVSGMSDAISNIVKASDEVDKSIRTVSSYIEEITASISGTN